jgi:Zn-dependent protease with chaperone function
LRGERILTRMVLDKNTRYLKMAIGEFGHRFRGWLRGKIYICAVIVCSVTILLGYLYSYVGGTDLKQVSIVVLYISAGILALLWGNLLVGNIVGVARIFVVGRKTVSWVEIPEFTQLAREMKVKLHKKRPFGVMQGFTGTGCFPITKQIVFAADLLDTLGDQERLALATHELTHLKGHRFAKQLTISCALAILVALTVTEGPYVEGHDIVATLPGIATGLTAFALIGQKNEYAGDAAAAAKTSNKVAISLLERLAPPDEWAHESQLHPSIEKRIARLSKKQPSPL